MTALDVDVQGQIGALSVALTFRAAGEPVTIIGPNGAGKTTALRLILGDLTPRAGRVTVGDQVVFDGERGIAVAVERRSIGFLPQRYALFPHLDVLGNVAYGIEGGSRATRREAALSALRALDATSLASRRPSELSGGEAQRVALARALAAEPRALLLDEPLAALDVELRRDLRQFLAQYLRALRIPTVVVTHDRTDVELLDGQVIVLERGEVVQRGRQAELAASPATDFVRQFWTVPEPR